MDKRVGFEFALFVLWLYFHQSATKAISKSKKEWNYQNRLIVLWNDDFVCALLALWLNFQPALQIKPVQSTSKVLLVLSLCFVYTLKWLLLYFNQSAVKVQIKPVQSFAKSIFCPLKFQSSQSTAKVEIKHN